MGFIEGSKSRPLENAGAPSNGIDEVQNLNFTGGTPTTGVFTLKFEGFETADIAFNATAGNVANALALLPSIGSGNIGGSGGALPSVTVALTFQGNLAKKAISNPITAGGKNTMDNSAVPTIAVGTPGVTAFRRGSGPGALAIDVTNGKHYINTGTALEPTWVVTGTQT